MVSRNNPIISLVLSVLVSMFGVTRVHQDLNLLTDELHHAGFEPSIHSAGSTGASPEQRSLSFTASRPSDESSQIRADHPFPRWDNRTGIPLPPLIAFMEGVLQKSESVIYVGEREAELHRERARSETFHAETIYVVDAKGVHASQTTRSRNSRGQIRYRVKPTENIMVQALELLLQESSSSSDFQRWSRLRQAVQEQGGFPFVAYYGDFKSCCTNNWRDGQYASVPLFTVAAQVSCQHAFPMPTYKTISESKGLGSEWDDTMNEWKRQYAEKIPKVVWRGGLTGPIANWTNVRWRMASKANGNDEESRRLFDVAFTSIPPRHNNYHENVTERVITEGLWAHSNVNPMSAFQQYAAILDADGNSWSSRFGSLLCYSSVVLKVDPLYVDYFYLKAEDRPVPWEHFVPVQNDLSDLHEHAAWVLDPANAKAVAQIVKNANGWCRRQLSRPTLARDYLDIWQAYVEYLDSADPSWYKHSWELAKEAIFSRQSDYDMVELKQ